MGPVGSGNEVYYRWVDADGRLHLVTSLDSVPAHARAKAERVEMNAEASRSLNTAVNAPAESSPAFEVHWLSFGVGFGAALLLALVFRLLPQSARWVSRLAIVACVAGLLIGAYFGLIRKTTGAGTSAFASPSAFIDDAKSAVEKMNLRQKAQAEEIRQIQAEGK